MASGSCLCGTVQFTLADDVSALEHCHCSMCRKSHGTPFVSFVLAHDIHINQGRGNIARYESSPGFHRSFCNVCGSPVPGPDDETGNAYIAAGSINEPFKVNEKLQRHIFVESKVSWLDIDDKLPQVSGYGDDDSSRVVEQADRASGKVGEVHGSCLCGDVSFRYKNPKLMMFCHCSRCRKVKGAAHAANAFVAPADFEWLSGEDKITDYDLPDAKRFGNSFCQSCGSSVPRKSEHSPMYNVPVGSLDDAPGVDSKGHIFVGSKSSWYRICDSRPQYQEMPDN